MGEPSEDVVIGIRCSKHFTGSRGNQCLRVFGRCVGSYLTQGQAEKQKKWWDAHLSVECRNACLGIRDPEMVVGVLLGVMKELHEFADDLDNGADEVAELVLGELRPRMRLVLGRVDFEKRKEAGCED
jgi:hypothetical protein